MEDPLQDVDGQFSFEEDVIINTLKEESKNLYFAIKLDQFEEYLMEEELKE